MLMRMRRLRRLLRWMGGGVIVVVVVVVALLCVGVPPTEAFPHHYQQQQRHIHNSTSNTSNHRRRRRRQRRHTPPHWNPLPTQYPRCSPSFLHNEECAEDENRTNSQQQQRRVTHRSRTRAARWMIQRWRGGGKETRAQRVAATHPPYTERYRRRGMALTLLLSNFSVMGAKCALPSVLSLLLSSTRGLTFVTKTTPGTAAVVTSAAGSASAAVLASVPRQQFAHLLGLSTLAIALGKLVLGPVIDAWGGIRSLQLTLVVLTFMLGTLAVRAQQFGVFAVCWLVIDFVFSSCWAACLSAIQQSFPDDEWGRQIGNLATGARLGNAVSFSLFAAILYALEDLMVQPWRVIFFVSMLLQVVPLCLLCHFGGITLTTNTTTTTQPEATAHDQQQQQAARPPNETMRPPPESNTSNNNNNHNKKTITGHNIVARSSTTSRRGVGRPTFRDSFRILQREARTPEFWLHLIARSCLMVFASFLLFVPTVMHQLYGCSNAVAAQVASAYSLGCLLAVVGGARFFASLFTPSSSSSSSTSTSSTSTSSTSSNVWQPIAAIISLLGLATAASALQLVHALGRTTLSWTMATVSMFLWGVAFSLPFYLPSSLYALARGGRDCSASIADCFDFVGFTLLACFNKYVAAIEHPTQRAAWIGCFQITTACSVIAMIAQSFAVFFEAKKRRERTSTTQNTIGS